MNRRPGYCSEWNDYPNERADWNRWLRVCGGFVGDGGSDPSLGMGWRTMRQGKVSALEAFAHALRNLRRLTVSLDKVVLAEA
jgi:hypothetical protein